MRRAILTFLFVPALALPCAISLDAQQGVVIASYYECDPTLEAALDIVVTEAIAPYYQGRVDSGELAAWGWNAHVMGGAWRRLGFMIAPDRASGMATRAAILEELQSEQPAAVRLVNTVCPTHEDYIWTVDDSSQPPVVGTGPFPTLTAYYSCIQGQEAEADRIVRESITPVLEALVRDGYLNGWSWLIHDSGGWFRRAAVWQGDDHSSILNAIDLLGERLAEGDALTDFATICGSHVDYQWSPVTPG